MNHSDIEHMAQGFPPSHIGKDAEEVITHLATELLKFQEQRDALAAENAGMDRFVDSLLSIAWQGGSADGSDIQELALKHGLIRQESYCADSHENLVEDAGNFEEGDEVYFRVETPATTAYLNSVRAEVIPDNLKIIGDLIRTQDNRITDQPMFVVFEKREIIGSDEHSPSRIVWVWEGEEVDELRGKRLEMLYQDGRDTRGYDRYAMQEIDVFVTACFTEQGCKNYLRRNGHNLRQPYIYAAGSYRNDEYQSVRNWLASLPHVAKMVGA